MWDRDSVGSCRPTPSTVVCTRSIRFPALSCTLPDGARGFRHCSGLYVIIVVFLYQEKEGGEKGHQMHVELPGSHKAGYHGPLILG